MSDYTKDIITDPFYSEFYSFGGSSGIDNPPTTDFCIHRHPAYVINVSNPHGANTYSGNDVVFKAPSANSDIYNLITSIENDLNNPHATTNPTAAKHAPVIDLDVPCELIPSSQPGHWHLYIHKSMDWASYSSILTTFRNAGLIEDGYYNASLSKGFTAVRPISRYKPGIKQTVVSFVKKVAILKRQNYLLGHAYNDIAKKYTTLLAREAELLQKIDSLSHEISTNTFSTSANTFATLDDLLASENMHVVAVEMAAFAPNPKAPIGDDEIF